MKQPNWKRPARPRTVAVRTEEKLWKQQAEACRLVRQAALLALSDSARKGGITILLTGDDALAALNARFRGKTGPTNVLSFPSDDPEYLGDVAIAYGVAAAEADAQGKVFAAHAAHLAMHGVLHLLGHDHMNDRDAAAMETLEARLLARLGVANPYHRRKAA